MNTLEPGESPRTHGFLARIAIVLVGLGLILAFASGRSADAATGAKVPPATLDTADGPYVIGEPPGRVEVLFFSFPG